MKKIVSLVTLLLIVGFLCGDIIYVGENQYYTSINAALQNVDPGDIVKVHPGTYVENVVIDTDDITLCSVSDEPENTIIDGNNLGTVLKIDNSDNIVIQGFTIQNGTGSNVYEERGFWGGGILSYQSNNLLVNNCIVQNNEADGGGGICLFEGSMDLDSCIIKLNEAAYGAGIKLQTTSGSQEHFNMNNSTLSNNHATYSGGGILAQITSGYLQGSIINSLIESNSAGSSGGAINWSGVQYGQIPLLNIENVTIVNNSSPVYGGINANTNTLHYKTYVNLTNSILWGNSGTQIAQSSYTTIEYSDVQSGYNGNGNIDLDPLFVDSSNGDYRLSWDSSNMSPCIDTGDPTKFDEDGTRSDMGCFPYTGVRYINDSWELYSYNVGDRTSSNIKWQGLPSLDTFTTDGDVAENVFAEIMGEVVGSTTTLDTCKWVELETDTKFEIFEGLQGWEDETETLSRIQGYKFIVKPNLTQNVSLDIIGEQVAENTVISLTAGMENWTCYHLDKTQDWDEAFGSSLSNIYFVQTQYWTMQRAYAKPGAPWCLPAYSDLTLSRGDMVIVKCFNNEDFTWNDGLISIPVVPAKSTAFTFEEELDYIPVNLEFDEVDAPLEVAVLADGICQGAAVVEDGVAQVCAYITDNAGEELELEFYYGERSAVESVKRFKVFNAEANCFVSKQIVIKPEEDYYHISLREEQESIENLPVKLSLGNYPNPFNPTTTVSFNLPNEAMVELEVYNVKGQLVKSLLNEITQAGTHSVEWKGVDNSGQKVSSGIYFSRLKTNKEVLNKKMILMK